jgi:periplasmic divalent cation tolerance protein
MADLSIVYTLVANSDDARELAYKLIEKSLVVCVNIVPQIESIYPWEGVVQSSPECMMIVKTRPHLRAKLHEHLEANHPYQVPAIIDLAVDGVNEPFAQWIKEHLP